MTIWLSRGLVLAIHDEQLAEHGGAGGLRDAGLLDNALACPANRVGYEKPDADAVIFTLQMAAGDMDDDAFISWVRANVAG